MCYSEVKLTIIIVDILNECFDGSQIEKVIVLVKGLVKKTNHHTSSSHNAKNAIKATKMQKINTKIDDTLDSISITYNRST